MLVTVINNSLVADEAKQRLNGLIQYFPDPDKDEALFNAKLYFGLEGRDATLPENQKLVYALQEDGSAIPIPQPVRTGVGGVPMYNNSNVTLAVSGSFSFTCLDSNDVQKYRFPSVEAINAQGFVGQILEESQVVGNTQVLIYEKIECTTASFYIGDGTSSAQFKGRYLLRDIDYIANSATQITLTGSIAQGTKIVGRQIDPTGSTSSVSGSATSIIVADTVSFAKALDLKVNDRVTLNGKDTIGDGLGGDYLTVAANSGVADNENYIALENGLQLKLVSANQKLKKHVDTVVSNSITSGALTIDCKNGNAHTITLTENVSSIQFINVNKSGSTTITLKVKQGTSLYSLAWPSVIKWPSDAAPEITQTIDKVDIYGLITYDGNTWFGATVGQDYDD